VIGRAPRRLEGQALKSSGYRQLHIRRDARPQGVIAYATIENAGKLNAINSALMGELVEGMGELAADDRLRAVVLTGAGPKAFIAGVDINEMARIENGAQATAFITRLHQCCAAIRDVPVPVIARIQGYAFGGGLELAAACDVRIAADAAVFGMPEVKLGIPSVIEAALLPTLVGWGRARLAPRERDLGETLAEAEGDDPWYAYVEAGGRPEELSADTMELFALQRHLDEIAAQAAHFSHPHGDTADDRRGFGALERELDALVSNGG